MGVELLEGTLTIPFWVGLTIWLVAVIIYAVASVVLYYHWNKYGMDNPVITRARNLYFIITGILLVLALIFMLIAYV